MFGPTIMLSPITAAERTGNPTLITAAKALSYGTLGLATIGTLYGLTTSPLIAASGGTTAATAGIGGSTAAGGLTTGGVLLASQAIKTGGQLGMGALILDYMQKNPIVVIGGIAIIGYFLLGGKKK